MAPKEEKGKKYLACSCGYNNKKAPAQAKEIMKEVIKKPQKDDLAVVSEDDTHLPLTDEVCPKCKHGKAFWWSKQTRASDEPETRFLRCEKCKHTWRDRS
jgi:DNA-directed RNA polymerase subunit M